MQAQLARGETPKRREGGPSRPLLRLEPSAPLLLQSRPGGDVLVNTHELAQPATAVPMHPFTRHTTSTAVAMTAPPATALAAAAAAPASHVGSSAATATVGGEETHFRAAVLELVGDGGV